MSRQRATSAVPALSKNPGPFQPKQCELAPDVGLARARAIMARLATSAATGHSLRIRQSSMYRPAARDLRRAVRNRFCGMPRRGDQCGAGSRDRGAAAGGYRHPMCLEALRRSPRPWIASPTEPASRSRNRPSDPRMRPGPVEPEGRRNAQMIESEHGLQRLFETPSRAVATYLACRRETASRRRLLCHAWAPILRDGPDADGTAFRTSPVRPLAFNSAATALFGRVDGSGQAETHSATGG